MSSNPTPNEIRSKFLEFWTGNDDELDMALEMFYHDVSSSFKLALEAKRVSPEQSKQVLQTVEDYVGNQYF